MSRRLIQNTSDTMNLNLWIIFVASTIFISATPGPNMLLMLSHGARYGWRATLATMAGAISGLAILIGLSALGVGAILMASPALFQGLKLVGGVYLIYLGVQCWRAGETMNMPEKSANTAYARYQTGFTVALSNPKAILFAGAFLPQFIDLNQPQEPQWLILLVSFFCIESLWQVAYAWGGHQLAQWLLAPGRIRRFNRCCALAFFLVGSLLAFTQ
jgi:threonine/homoserine/homoserine lactone efflux protein